MLASLIPRFPPLPTHVAFIIGLFTFCQVRAQWDAGICVNFVATVFDNSDVIIIAIVIVLTFSASVSSFTVFSSFVWCFEIFGVFDNSISWRDPWRRLPFSFPIFWFSFGGLWNPPVISKKASLWLMIRGVHLLVAGLSTSCPGNCDLIWQHCHHGHCVCLLSFCCHFSKNCVAINDMSQFFIL